MSNSVAVRYNIGDIVFVTDKARRGIFEKVCIKEFRPTFNRCSNIAETILYTDTLNGLWNEEELCVKQEALEFALAYWQSLLE